jgi:hypothetical protein
MPHRTKNAGDFVVTYLNANEEKLGSYTMEDPTHIRSCDLEYGSNGALRRRPSGIIEILLPYDPRIVKIEVGFREAPTMIFDITKQTKKVMKDIPE